jgi:plastocyanin
MENDQKPPVPIGQQNFTYPEDSHTKSGKKLVFGGLLILTVVLVVVVAGLLLRTNKNSDVQASKHEVAAATAAPAQITITPQGVTPTAVTIKQGQTVVWTNSDEAPHQIVSGPFPQEDQLAGFRAPAPALKRDTYSYTFNQKGTFQYVDHLNPQRVQGTVVVE